MNNIFYFKYVFSLLILSSATGVLLRLMRVIHVEFISFDNLLLSHNFISLFGWFYSIFFLGISIIFLRRFSLLLFWITQASIIFVFTIILFIDFNLVTLYALPVFTILFYIFTGYFLLNTAKADLLKDKNRIEFRFTYSAFLFLALSTLGIWRLFNLFHTGDNVIEIEPMISLIVNFQIHGWLTFAMIGIFLRYFKIEEINFDVRKINFAYWFLFIPLFFPYFITMMNVKVPGYITAGALLSTTGQLIGMMILYREFIPVIQKLLTDSNKWIAALFTIFKVVLILKFVLPVIVVFPFVSEFISQSRDVVVAFIHLSATGFILFGILIWCYLKKIITFENNFSSAGIAVFLFGFMTEMILLFANGFRSWFAFPVIPYYHGLILFTAVCMFAGLAIFWTGQLKTTS
jgi:hypothetical protein